MDEFSNYLLSGKNHAKLSPESLEMMGKQAANMFLDQGIALNDGIAKLAAEHKEVSAEQVKRIVEFANTAVYLARHDQSKTAGAEHSYPQFDLADAGRIIQDLSDGARPTVVTKTDIDYSRQSKKEKVSSAQTEEALTELFKVASSEKDYSRESIVHAVMAAKESLISLKDNLQDRYNQHEALFKEATADFYDQMKRHVLDGGSFGEAYAALKAGVGESVHSYMEPIVKGLIQEKVASYQDLKAQFASAEKLAHRVVNPDHPLLHSFSAMSMAGEELQKVSYSLTEIDTELDTVQEFIKKAYFTKEAIGPLAGLAARAGPAIGRGLSTMARKAMKDPIGTVNAVGTVKDMIPKKAPVPPPGT